MLRKIIHIFLFLLLLVTTTGLVVSKHFCKKVFVSASLFVEAEDCCEKECCENHSEFLQLDKDFQISEVIQIPVVFDFEIFVSEPSFFLLLNQQTDRSYYTEFNDPPPLEIHTRLSLKQTYLL